MTWILNQKRYRPVYFIGSVLVMAVELMLLGICLVLFRVVGQSRKTDWYQVAMQQQVETDVFASVKDDNVFIALSVAIAFVIIFVIVSICIVRTLQLEQMKKSVGIYMTCGHTMRQMEGLLVTDVGIDILIAMPFAFLLCKKMLEILMIKEEFLVMLSAIRPDGGLLWWVILLGGVALAAVMAGYGKLWLKNSVKGGLAPVIRQNG